MGKLPAMRDLQENPSVFLDFRRNNRPKMLSYCKATFRQIDDSLWEEIVDKAWYEIYDIALDPNKKINKPNALLTNFQD